MKSYKDKLTGLSLRKIKFYNFEVLLTQMARTSGSGQFLKTSKTLCRSLIVTNRPRGRR